MGDQRSRIGAPNSRREACLLPAAATAFAFTGSVGVFAGAKYTIAAPAPALTRAMRAALGSSGTAPHPGMLETAHRMTVTMLAATPPAIAFVAIMTGSFRT